MAIRSTAALAAICGLAATGAQAQEVSGGELRFGYERFLNDDTAVPGQDSDAKYSLEGSVELAFGNGAAQLDLALDRFGITDESSSGATLHGMYKPADTLAAGAFYGFENSDLNDYSFYGIEGVFEGPGYGAEAYVMNVDIDGSDLSGTLGGIAAGYDVMPNLRGGTRIVYGELDGDESIARYALTADYRFSSNATVSAELGRFDNDGPGPDDIEGNYIGVVTTFSFGPGQSTTFDRRGFIDLLPGF